MNRSRSGRRSLNEYEFTNLLFMILVVAAIFVTAFVVFNYYKTKDDKPVNEDELAITDSIADGTDFGMFYLHAKIAATPRQYQSRLNVPVTDDGFLKELFDLPGVEEITLNQTSIMIKKNSSTPWARIQPGVHRIVKEHQHLHY